jgi:hypothetical protein
LSILSFHTRNFYLRFFKPRVYMAYRGNYITYTDTSSK